MPDFIIAMSVVVAGVAVLSIGVFLWKITKYPNVRKNISEFHDLLRKGLLH